MRHLTQKFFEGLLVLLPITLTGYIAYVLFTRIDALGRSVLGQWVTKEYLLTGFGFFGTIIFIVMIGYFSSFWLTGTILKGIDGILAKSPFIRGVYSTIRDTVHSFLGEKKFFSQAVLVDLPKLGYQRVGFITQDTPSFYKTEEEKVVVYMPHSFQVSGEMIVVAKSQVTMLDLRPEEALKLIMSAGIATKSKSEE